MKPPRLHSNNSERLVLAHSRRAGHLRAELLVEVFRPCGARVDATAGPFPFRPTKPCPLAKFWERNLLDLKFWSTVLSKGERAAAVQPTLGTLSIRHGVGGKPENHLSPCVAQRLSAANVNLITIRNGPRDMT